MALGLGLELGLGLGSGLGVGLGSGLASGKARLREGLVCEVELLRRLVHVEVRDEVSTAEPQPALGGTRVAPHLVGGRARVRARLRVRR